MRIFWVSLTLLILGGIPSVTRAGVMFDQNVTPNVIFGFGNANGAWTVDRSGGVELGLRAKLRFDSSNMPQNIFNSSGDGSYTFEAGTPPTGFSFAPGSPRTAVWNFEWSINSNYDGTSGFQLDDLTYLLAIDSDPGPGVSFSQFDPIHLPDPLFGDHAIGDNSTGNGGGTSAADRPDYLGLIASNNVAQNSWNLEFFPTIPFSADAVGTYTFQLTAFSNGNQVAQTTINVNTVPEHSSLLTLAGLGLCASWIRRRRDG